MKKQAWVILALSFLTLSSGVVGFLMAGSKVSLGMGTLFGFFLGGAAISLFQGKKGGFYLAFSLTLLLTLFFLFRYLKTDATAPALLALLNGGVTIFLGLSKR